MSHEQHAAHAADGYARSSGRVGVCIATSGPGATNLVTGIATAYMDSVPLVAITGNVSRSLLGKDSFQEVDIAGITMPIVKHNWIVKDLEDLAEIVREAFVVARSGRPGPVLIDIPKDLTAALGNWEGSPGLSASPVLGERARRLLERTERPTFTGEDIDRAVEMLQEARRPLLYAGGGLVISGASEELLDLAERLNAPVASSLMGTGAFPRNHRLSTGLIGMHGTVASNKAAQKADLVVALGARFSDRVTSHAGHFAQYARVLHLDIDPAEVNKNVRSDFAVIGDLKLTLGEILKKISPRLETGWNGEIEKWKALIPRDHHRKTSLHPRFVIRETARRLGDEAVAVTDVGQHQIWTVQFYPFNRPRSFLSSGGLGTMGYGLGAAAGAKFANPDRPVVLFTGDGCFRMNAGEMATLGVYGLPLLIVVFNNRALGMVRQWQNFFYEGRYSETGLAGRPPDFVKLAEAYDATGYRAGDEAAFSAVLEKALKDIAGGRPALIEALIDQDERVLPMVPGGKPIDEQILDGTTE